MGYYTDYSLETNAPGIEEDIAEAIADESGFGGNIFRHDYCECKWYGHKEDMLNVSKKFPDVIFILTGEGEEPGDLWKKRFVNGQVDEVRAEITYPDFPPLPEGYDDATMPDM